MSTTKTMDDSPERAAPKNLVLSLVRRSNETKMHMQSISGELGQEIKEAVENKHLHASALKLISKLARMDEIKRLAFLAAFDLYRTYAEEARLFGFEHIGDLVNEAEAASEQEHADNIREFRGLKKTGHVGARPSDSEEPLPPAA